MNFDDYRLRDRATYTAFVGRICDILASAVKARSILPYSITGRAKDPDSLQKKLVNRGLNPQEAIEAEIKDLAGTRVIFLTNAKVKQFVGSGIIHDNFEVVSVNVHHAVPGTDSESKLFSSVNYLVRLKPERLALPEYAAFARLKAEIQVQTLLNNAWAEMNHDAFYKEPQLRHVDRSQFEKIAERMDAVMREHLLPAGHDFDKISRDLFLLIEAEQSLEPALATLKNSRSNDEIVAAIEKLEEVVMPRLTRRCDTFLAALPDLVRVLTQTRSTTAVKIHTEFGDYDGKTGLDVARSTAKLIRDHRLCYPKLTLSTLFEFYDAATTSEEQSIWLELGGQFAKHDLHIWKSHGPAVQRVVIDGIQALEPNFAKRSRTMIFTLLKEVLSCDAEGMSHGVDLGTLNIQRGAVVPSEPLQRVRTDALSVLTAILLSADSDKERREVLDAFRSATRPPVQGSGVALRTMVMRDTARVISIERQVASGCGLELRRQMEVAALHTHHWSRDVPIDYAADVDFVTAQRVVAAEINALRDQLNADREYVFYRIVVGYDSVRPDAWTAEPFDHQATANWRISADSEIFAAIATEGIEHWSRRLRNFLCEAASNDNIRPTAAFVGRLAVSRPEAAVYLLEHVDDGLSKLVPDLIFGLEKAGRSDTVHRFASSWIAEGRFLEPIATWLGGHAIPDRSMLHLVIARASELEDGAAILALSNAAAQLWTSTADQWLVDEVFMPTLDYFITAGSFEWVHRAWNIWQDEFVSALTQEQCSRLLNSFVETPKIGYCEDRILSLVGDMFPKLVMDFFEDRIRKENDREGHRFDPIPDLLHDLKAVLARNAELLLQSIRTWYDLAPSMHRFRGGQLFSTVFPDLPSTVMELLVTLVHRGDWEDLAFTLETLTTYEGIEQIYPLCMDIVDRLSDDDDLLKRVREVLDETGVVSGEFGFVEVESAQLRVLEPYLEDPRPRVSSFVQSARHSVMQSRAWQQLRAEHEVEQRRRDWPND